MSNQIQNPNDKNYKKISARIKENVSLKELTTFQIGGQARYFVEVKTKKELTEALQWARGKGASFFVLGGGSNLLVSDQGFKGLAIKVQSSKFKVQNCNSKFKIIQAGGGVVLADLVELIAKEGLSGLEWASGIPRATVGGACCMNAGAFGQTMADVIEQVEVFDSQAQEFKTLTFKDCQFGYKESIFKKNKHLIICSVVLKLEKREPAEIKKEIARVLDYRQNNHPMDFPSAGSIFKNPFQRPAGQLIEEAGLGGKIIGKAKIAERHCNFIVNLGGASSKDVLALIKLAKEKVKEKFKLHLEEEAQFIQ